MEKLTLLIVDDDQPNLTIFKAMYRREYNVLTAISAEEGWQQLRDHPEIKVVFSDFRMPRIDGLEFIEKARSDHSHISFVIFSGSDVHERMRNAIESGLIDGFLRKPFDSQLLNETIQKFTT